MIKKIVYIIFLMVAISPTLFLGVVALIEASFVAQRYEYEEINKKFWGNFKDKGFKRVNWQTMPTSGMGLTYDTKVELGPNQSFFFFGEDGFYLLALDSSGNVTPVSVKNKFKNYSFKNSVRLYLGYYYPDKRTGSSITPYKTKHATLYVNLLAGSSEKANIDVLPNSDKKFRVRQIAPLKGAQVYIIGFLVLAFIFFGLLHLRWCRNDKSLRRKKAPSSMRYLFKKEGRRRFYCIYCSNELKVKGRFRCRGGHTPAEEKYIFEDCDKCEDKHDKIKCKSCFKEIHLFEENYNEEEILNRGEPYISRPYPITKLEVHLFQHFIWISFFLILIGQPYFYFRLQGDYRYVFIDIYRNIYGFWNYYTTMNYSVFAFFVVWLAWLVFKYMAPKKEHVARNPYEK